MSNPWDPMSFPLMGDHDDSTLFEALGRALDKWEFVEFGLAMLYSLFVGDQSFAKTQEYGGGKIFRERLAGLQRVAEAWFVNFPSQQLEGEFDKLTTAARGFSDRRNEFAHGLVMDVRPVMFWRSKMTLASPNLPQFIVGPPLYLGRKHDLTGMPTFGYSSIELELIYDRMTEFELEVDRFIRTLWPSALPHG
ncbi:hypothetical protein NKH70_22915 [Mesorhizobium sp. M0991]|uniref:hypothetical protein n=1 Tax=Mesorhizobium sp. M0991 TaxID=2957043 RepID=UPI00333D6A15